MSNVITEKEVFSLIPKRKDNSSKYDYGKIMAVCGSTFYRGAAALSCSGALRCGVGIAILASTEKVVSAVAPTLHECTFIPLTETRNGTISAANCDAILAQAKRCNALLIGCGLAIDNDTKSLVKRLVCEADCQLILDADALNVISECPDVLKRAKMPPVITPHWGEMARLCKTKRDDIAYSPAFAASKFAKQYNCFVVLKSHITYIAHHNGTVAINSETGNSGLAKGGSGDILAGMIASFCAQKMHPFDAAKCGVFLHGAAADKCAERLSKQAMLPSDILTDLCCIFAQNQ